MMFNHIVLHYITHNLKKKINKVPTPEKELNLSTYQIVLLNMISQFFYSLLVGLAMFHLERSSIKEPV